jgi:hypothetical protein
MIWTVQNHFGPIEGQGIRALFLTKLSEIDLRENYMISQLCPAQKCGILIHMQNSLGNLQKYS